MPKDTDNSASSSISDHFLSISNLFGRFVRRNFLKLTPIQLRTLLDRLSGLYPGNRSVVFKMKELNGIPAAHLFPKKTIEDQQRKTVILVHGGAFAFGSVQTHRALATALVRSVNCEVWIPAYRLAPEFPFPIPLEDVVRSCEAIIGDAQDWWLLGDSAGGNLAMSALFEIANKHQKIPNGLILLSPWLDLGYWSESNLFERTKMSPFNRKDVFEYARYYLKDLSPDNPKVYPLANDLSKLPKVYVEASEAEYLWYDFELIRKTFANQNRSLFTRIERSALHGWQLFPDILPEAKRSIRSISQFIFTTKTQPENQN
ncbi:MAG: alpha/beta hydrolase fold domain-containing protein [Flavobacteriales bacterium]